MRSSKRQAREAFNAAFPALESIVRHKRFEDVDEATGEVTILPVYPRDVIRATKVLLRLTREGYYRKSQDPQPAPGVRKDSRENRSIDVNWLIMAPSYPRRETTMPDGTRISVTVEQDGDVIEPDE